MDLWDDGHGNPNEKIMKLNGPPIYCHGNPYANHITVNPYGGLRIR